MDKCPKDENGYHDPERLREEWDAIIEYCKICKKKLIYMKRDGKINEAEYYNDHIRDFAQPYGSTAKIFYRIHGKRGRASVRYAQSLLAGVKSKDQLRAEWDDTLKESQKEMKRMNEFGKFTTTSGA
jgi:hypothetical protein